MNVLLGECHFQKSSSNARSPKIAANSKTEPWKENK